MDWRETDLVPRDLSQWIDATKAKVLVAESKGKTAADYEDPVDQDMHRFFTEEFGEEAWAGREFLVWACYKDRTSCKRCRRLDGKIVPAAKGFAGQTGQGHEGCRCYAVALRVSDELVRRKLPGLQSDYDVFKAEVRRRKQDPYPAAEFMAGALNAQTLRGPHPTRPELGEVIVGINASDPKASSSEYVSRRIYEL